jgi:hypothetical protein
VRLHLSATIQDVMVQDLRARPEHSLVLIPNGGANYCSLTAALTTYVDPRKATPSLVLQLQVGGWVGGWVGGVKWGGVRWGSAAQRAPGRLPL